MPKSTSTNASSTLLMATALVSLTLAVGYFYVQGNAAKQEDKKPKPQTCPVTAAAAPAAPKSPKKVVSPKKAASPKPVSPKKPESPKKPQSPVKAQESPKSFAAAVKTPPASPSKAAAVAAASPKKTATPQGSPKKVASPKKIASPEKAPVEDPVIAEAAQEVADQVVDLAVLNSVEKAAEDNEGFVKVDLSESNDGVDLKRTNLNPWNLSPTEDDKPYSDTEEEPKKADEGLARKSSTGSVKSPATPPPSPVRKLSAEVTSPKSGSNAGDDAAGDDDGDDDNEDNTSEGGDATLKKSKSMKKKKGKSKRRN